MSTPHDPATRQPFTFYAQYHGFTYAALAAALGVSEDYVSRLARGKARPSRVLVKLMAALLGEPEAALFDDTA